MLPPDRIKPFLLHPDPDVRSFAAEYFGESWSDDPDLLPMVLDACERYGFDVPLSGLHKAESLVVTEASLGRVLGLLAKQEARSTIEHLNRLVVRSPAEVLRAHREEIRRQPNILPEYRRRILRRQEYLEWSGERLWAELRGFARRSEDAQYTNEVDLGYADDLVDALARHEVPDAATLVPMIEESEAEEGWLEVFLVDLAGRRRVREAVPALVDKFRIDTDYLLERAADALARIGDPEASRLIRRAFPEAPFHYRIYASGVLGRIKDPESEAATLALLESEPDEAIRMWLCLSLCELFSERSLDVVRREIASGEGETFRELCGPALAVVTILGVDPPPEAEAWEAERRRQNEAMARAWVDLEADFWPDDDEQEEDPFGPAPDDVPRWDVTPPIRNTGERVGRNDPCPCGSGKKFKKCCGRSA
jgi:hypothetical protein